MSVVKRAVKERDPKPKGRPKGAKNFKTAEHEALLAKAEERLKEVLPRYAFKGDAHMLLMSVYKDPNYPIDLRVDAAKAAIRYEKPALAAVEHSGTVANQQITLVQMNMTPQQAAEAYARMLKGN